jgi:acetamidase/formamidase
MSAAPPANAGRISTKELGEGAALHLPVWVEGADFSAGDGADVQGDGEVCIQWAGNLPVRHLRLTLPLWRCTRAVAHTPRCDAIREGRPRPIPSPWA